MHCEINQCLSACTPTKDSTVIVVSGTTIYFSFFFLTSFVLRQKAKNCRRQGTADKENTLHAPFKDFYYLSRKLINYLKLNTCCPRLS